MRDVTRHEAALHGAGPATAKRPRCRGKSSTADILGNHHQGRVKAKWGPQRQELTELRERFLHSRATLSETARETEMTASSEHMADSATDSYDRDWALAMISSDQNVLYEIDQALNRIDSGTYGICELTGRPIEPERLRAIPWTQFSAEAQAELEARHRAPLRMRLGEVGSCAAAADVEPAEEAEQLETAA